MSRNFRLMIVALVVLGDLVALALIAPRALRQGRLFVVVIMAASKLISTVVIIWVMFGLLA